MKRCLKKKIKTSFFAITSAVMLICFIAVLLKHNKINIDVVQTSSFEDNLNSLGYALRNEEVIYFNGENIMFHCGDAEKVAKDSIIAESYNSYEDLKNAYAIKSIENQTRLFQNPGSLDGISISFINKNINDSIYKLSDSNFDYNKDQMLYYKLWQLMNKKDVELGKSNSLNKKISNLKEEKEKFSKVKPIDCLVAPSYGNFLKYTDGFENVLEFKKQIENFNIDELKPELYSRKPLGKIIKSESWYIVSKMLYEDSQRVRNSNEILLSSIDKNYVQNIPVSLEYIGNKDASNNCVVVLSCDFMNEKLAYLRKENFKLTLGNYWGIKVDKKFLYKQDEKFGVYVKQNNYLKFKEVNIIFSGLDFIICEYGPEYYENDKYIQPGDKIVCSGKNLYEGKRVR